MIDSVLKGTGNSRFLKSAVPAGTSWADALAMLQAGTFPIDFNGINAEGFQQVGTPLNKANLLKDATAAQIGLPPSTTPDGMFQALGNTGELHVWRKTVVSKTPGYNLSVAQKNYLSSGSNYGSGNSRVTFTVSASVSVANDGTVTQNNPSSETYIYHQDVVSNVQNQIRGKFVSITTDHSSGYYSEPQDGIWFVPADANITLVENGTSLGYPYNYCYVADKMQKVTGHGQGTTTTYPVSTNPNAYQEGDDAKPAGYTLGDVVTGTFAMATGNVQYSYASSVSVSNDGTVSLVSPSSTTLSADASSRTIALSMRGKYVKATSSLSNCGVPFSSGSVVFLPADAVVSGTVDIDRYQPVTGYAAIPAGTTIEYLGKLGDKARVQVVSYVGTGTYGSEHPTVVNFDFPPKMVIIREDNNAYDTFDWIIGMTSVEVHWDGSYNCFVAVDCTKLSFYSLRASSDQMNTVGKKYYAVAIG